MHKTTHTYAPEINQDDLVRMSQILRHRLRNIASGIRGAVTLIQEETCELIASDLQEYFPLMVKECEGLQDIANRLSLIFDKPELDTETDSIQNITDSVCAAIMPLFPHVECRKLHQDQEYRVPVAMKVALRELVINACEAAPKGTVTIKVLITPSTATWRVMDSAPPIDNETRTNLFMPFFTKRPRHLGLGLSIARRIAIMYNGTCKFVEESSAPNQYAFELTCSVDQQPAKS